MPEFYGNNGVSKLIQAGYGENLFNSHGFDIIMQRTAETFKDASRRKPVDKQIGRYNTRY